MKHILILSLGFLVFFLPSCQKESVNDVSESDSSNPLLLRGDGEAKKADAYILLEFDEYFDNPFKDVTTIFAAGFKKGSDLIDAGNVSINGHSLEKQIDNRLLLTPEIRKNRFLGKHIVASFKSGGFLYNDFDQMIYIPKQLNVSSNIAGNRYFDKTKDLTLTWTPDANNTYVYLGICSQGSPCIFKRLPDNGSATIKSNEFNAFKANSNMTVHIGRGKNICIDNNGKRVCVAAFNNARMTRRIVQ